MKVQIEWRDIADGACGEPNACALALAIKRAVPGVKVSVGGVRAWVGDRQVELPDDAVRFVNDIDEMVLRNLDVRPCTVDLDLEDVRAQA
jgi:hypothetical protein